MERDLFLKGAAIGFSIAMAVGPIALLCIHNSLRKGFREGFAIGLGAALADAFYGAVAGFGVAAISAFLGYKTILQVIGGLFLCYLGVDMFRGKEVQARKELKEEIFWMMVSTAFFLTMTNPMTILSFIGIYAGLKVGGSDATIISVFSLTSGIFFGSVLWYFLLSLGTSFFKSRLTVTSSRWLNRISGSILFVFGLASLVTAIVVF